MPSERKQRNVEREYSSKDGSPRFGPHDGETGAVSQAQRCRHPTPMVRTTRLAIAANRDANEANSALANGAEQPHSSHAVSGPNLTVVIEDRVSGQVVQRAGSRHDQRIGQKPRVVSDTMRLGRTDGGGLAESLMYAKRLPEIGSEQRH